ncbi:peptidoglycan DD-metalloendopeptidase family protein [Lusitaniella coriacea]|uniref:peptidoglycan DD-metalloendopeptidase family protein n=1 Tax=Lusitaniella coriacea TaxID=1983105 RepID=UPI001D140EDA|nr:peptidoglycan DD-metalloendopeptidase family protein [Lusitaniella coriacea]
MRLFQKLFGVSQKDRTPPEGFGQTFILEPILTPSGLVDSGDDFIDPTVFDLDSPVIDDFDLDIAKTGTEAFNSDADIEEMTFLTRNIDLDEISPVGESLHSHDLFTSGTFTVGDSGEVSIDFLFDGGKYEGELAIFSLDGMEQFEPGSDAFIQEAASRALSSSELGHVVISDPSEGAKFSGNLGERSFNEGDYQGVKSFQMNAGSEFGVMLVPNGTVEQVYENPDIGGAVRPLFSMATSNPDDAFHVGQIADATGDGNTFVLEDLRVDGRTDRDYNDIIFQVRGATGDAVELDEVIDSDGDWRETDMGQALLDYAEPYLDVEGHDHGEHGDLPNDPQLSPNLPPIQDGEIAEPDGYEFSESDQPLIGTIDTGFNENNPYLDYDRVTIGNDYIDSDANSLLSTGEGNEHGTHVLGVINNVNSDAPLWVSRAVGSGQWADSLVEFVDAAQESGQPNAVVNLSFDLTQINPDRTESVRTAFTPAEWAALEYAHQNNVVIVAATGNDSGVISALGQASQQFDNIITVGAAEQLDSSLSIPKGVDRAYYSNYGESVDIVAFGGTPDNPEISTVGEGLGTMAGTSVATAKVTGAISQVWAANPQLSYQQVIEILELTATDLLAHNRDVQTGSGLLNLAAAVHLAKATEPSGVEATTPVSPAPWSDAVRPTERPVNITEVSFSGRVISTIPTNVRSGPGTSFLVAGTRNPDDIVDFGAWTRGELVSYPSLGTSDDRWYRIAGTTDQWISAALIDGQPPTTNPTLPNQFTFEGKTYTWVPYTIKGGDTLSIIALRTMGNGSALYYNFIAQHNGITNPNLIDAGSTILVPQEVGSNPNPPAPTPGPAPVDPGKFYNPLAGSSYTIPPLNEFGTPRRISGTHKGIDLSASAGTPIKAAKAGTVVIARVGWNDGYGNYVKIDHGNGEETRYAHLSSINVQEGQQVSAGTHIGNVGNTGNSTGPHLHFEIRINGVAQNPRNYIQF